MKWNTPVMAIRPVLYDVVGEAYRVEPLASQYPRPAWPAHQGK